MSTRRNRDILRFLLLFAIILALNLIGNLRFFRVDLTSEGRYTLNGATKELLRSFEDKILVKVYLEGDFPAGFQRLQSETRQMLDEFRAYNANLEYVFINPNSGSEEEREKLYQQLQSRGLRPYQLAISEEGGNSVKTIFPGALMSYGEKEVPVSLLKDQLGASPEQQVNASVQNLEFALANAVRGLTTLKKPLVGFVQGHGEADPQEMADFANSLSQNYQVRLINIREFKTDSARAVPLSLAEQQRRVNRFDALIIAKPQRSFNELDKFLLDQFIMTGGKTMWLIDPVKAEIDSLSQKPQFMSLPIYDRLNIGDLLFKYGVRLNTNLVTDMVAAGLNDQQKIRPWIYFPLIMPRVEHPISKDLNAVWLQFASTIDTLSRPEMKHTALLKTSPYSATYAAPHIVNLGLYYNMPPRERFRRSGLIVADLMEGKFSSLFKNRLQPKATGEPIRLIEETEANKMIVVSDGDLIRNQLNIVNNRMPKGAPLPLGFDQFTGAQYGNSDFLLNAIDYLLEESGLIDIRSRELRIRLLDANRVKTERLRWQIMNTLIPVVLIVIFGFINRMIRRRRYR